MNPFERAILEDRGIDFNDAADFFIGIRQPIEYPGEKTAASTEEVQKAVDSGIMRGISQTEKDVTQAHASRGRRYGGSLGSIAGGAGGAAAGKKLIGGKKGAIAGLAAGYLAGGHLGKEVGTSADIHRLRKHMKKSAERLDYLDRFRALAVPASIGGGLGGGASGAILGGLSHGAKGALIGGLGGAALGAGAVGLPMAAGLATVPGVGEQAHAELRDPRTYSNLRGILSGESAAERVAAHEGLGKKEETIGGAARKGWNREKGEKTSSILRMRFKVAMAKLANPPPGAAESTEAPMSSPTDTQQLQPQNYLQAELLGQQAQGAQEAEFYRGQAQQAQTAAQMAQQQLGDLQGQLQQLQMQADQAGQQIQQATMGAVAAQDEALKQTQVAANMRMGMQKLRAQMLEVASQDPAEVAAQEMQGGAPPGAESEAAPQEGGAGPLTSEGGKEEDEAVRAQEEADQQAVQAEEKNQQDAAALAPPTAAPPGGGFPPGQGPGQLNAASNGGADMSTMEPASGLKMGHVKTAGAAMQQVAQRLPWALAGAGLGGLHHLSLKGSVPELRSKVEELQANTEGGFYNAMRLALKKQQLEDAQLAEQYPGHSLATQMGRGALVGALAGPMVGGNTQRIAQHIKDL